MYYYCTSVSLHARYYHDRQLVDGVTASFWSKQTVECGKQFTGKSSASMCQVCNIFLHCTLYVCWSPHIFFSKLKNLPHFWTALITLLVLLLTIGQHIFWTSTSRKSLFHLAHEWVETWTRSALQHTQTPALDCSAIETKLMSTPFCLSKRNFPITKGCAKLT